MPYPDNEPTVKRPKILLVDDREDNLLSIEAILEPDGYQFFRAYSGHQALKVLLNEIDFAMILMDVKMPVLNGFETATLIYERDRLRHIPIIFVTANNYGDENIFKGFKAGGIDYIFKPINPEVLRAKVSLFIEIYRKNAQLIEQETKLKAINEDLEKEIHLLRASGEKIKQANARMQREISDMESVLVSSRLSKDNFVFEEYDLNDLIKEFIEDIKDQLMERMATVEIETLPRVKVSLVLMRPLFHHLIRMGIDSNRDKEKPFIKIRSELGPNSKSSIDQEYCRIIFEDKSPGVAKNGEEASDTSNKQVNGSLKKFNNSLVICQKIMEQHSGFFEVNNTGNSKAFTISFPRSKSK